MFDFSKFFRWVQGGLFETLATWQAYKDQNYSWKVTATQFSAPLVVLWGVLAVVLGALFGTGSGFIDFLNPLIASALWFGLGSFIASFLASRFGGTQSFDQALAALTFAAIPGALGSVLGALPGVGILLALAGAIWSLILLWQALPVFLDLALERRTGHFFATLGLSIVGLMVSYTLLGAIGLGGFGYDGAASKRASEWAVSSEKRGKQSASPNSSTDSSGESSGDLWSYGDSESIPNHQGSGKGDSGDAGLFGFGREIDYLEQAGEDRYTPPVDGKLDEEQVKRTVRFFAAARRLRDESSKSLEKLGSENSEPSLSDIFKGVKGLVGAGTAEMQAVKSGGGNWAEHEWIKKQLFEARIHEDLNETTAHNFELYQRNEEALKEWL